MNLITSKDPMTFSTIQTLSNGIVNATPMAFDGSPGDDPSVAKSISERYKAQGLDPWAAYDDPETAMNDFTLKDFEL